MGRQEAQPEGGRLRLLERLEVDPGRGVLLLRERPADREFPRAKGWEATAPVPSVAHCAFAGSGADPTRGGSTSVNAIVEVGPADIANPHLKPSDVQVLALIGEGAGTSLGLPILPDGEKSTRGAAGGLGTMAFLLGIAFSAFMVASVLVATRFYWVGFAALILAPTLATLAYFPLSLHSEKKSLRAYVRKLAEVYGVEYFATVGQALAAYPCAPRRAAGDTKSIHQESR